MPHTALNAYDMVWAAAAAFAAAARRGPGSEAPLGEAANAEIKNVSFNGASGPLWFESNGDRGLRNHQLEIQNLLWDEASLSYVHRTVGLVQTGTGQSLTIDLYRDPALVWPDGTEYPEVRIHAATHQLIGFRPPGALCCCLRPPAMLAVFLPAPLLQAGL